MAKLCLSQMKASAGRIGRVLLGIAAMLALYLASISLSKTTLAGCGAESGCYHVLSSRWAYLFGMPVSFVGLGLYLTALFAAGGYESRGHRSWVGLIGEISVTLIAVAAVWFLVLQIFAIGHFCHWCCFTQFTALAGVIFLTISRRSERETEQVENVTSESKFLLQDGLRMGLISGAAVLGLTTLAVGPFIGSVKSLHVPMAGNGVKPVTVSSPNKPAETVLNLHKGKFQVYPKELPWIGAEPAKAKDWGLALVDYACDFCRLYHTTLKQVAETRGEDFSIVLLPGGLTDEGQRIQHVMLCLFRADRRSHDTLQQSLLEGNLPARYDAVLKAAVDLLGAEGYAKAHELHGGWAQSQIRTAKGIQEANYTLAQTRRLPQFLYGEDILVGFNPDAEKVLAFLDSTAPEKAGPAIAVAPRGPGKYTPLTPEELKQNPLAQPMMSLKRTSLDLGEIEPGATVPCEIEFQNIGQSQLKIDWLSLQEGCQVTKIPATEIPPGAHGVISLLVEAPTSGDSFQRSVKIHSNSGTGGQLLIQGTLKGGIPTGPPPVKKNPPAENNSGGQPDTALSN